MARCDFDTSVDIIIDSTNQYALCCYCELSMNNIKFKCSEEHCNYETMRVDNLKRHIDTVHQKKREICECGVSLCPTSMKRHKKNHCSSLRNKTNEVQSTNTDTVHSHKRSVYFPAMNNGAAASANNNESFKIRGKVVIDVEIESSNGCTSINHDPIRIDGYDLTVLPTHVVQEFLAMQNSLSQSAGKNEKKKK